MSGIKQRYPKHPMEFAHGEVIDEAPEPMTKEQWVKELSEGILKRRTEMENANIDLALRVLAAMESMEWSVTHFGSAWHQWGKTANERLHDLRMWRMAFENEVKTLLRDASDIRKFFLDEKHVEEVRRLKEFVEVCERLKALKTDGTLDALINAILTLECSDEKAKTKEVLAKGTATNDQQTSVGVCEK